MQFERDASDPFDSALSPLSLGYVSGTPWSSDLVKSLGGCDILVAGLEHTSPEDYEKLHYQSDSLGYFGTYTLLQEAQPRLLIIGELSGKEGDVRLELTRKMREEALNVAPQATILPADVGLYLDLNAHRLRCTMTGTFVDPEAMRIIKPHEPFGMLQYLSPHCML